MTAASNDLSYILRTGSERVVHDVLRRLHGPDSITEQPIAPGLSSLVPTPSDWVQALGAARRVADAVNEMIDRYAVKARGVGTPWQTIAHALGLDTVAVGQDPAIVAFIVIAGEPSQRTDDRYVQFRCAGCKESVRDYGPYNPHPADSEKGHSDDCEVLAAAVAAFRAREQS
jgi:hypothetical protein